MSIKKFLTSLVPLVLVIGMNAAVAGDDLGSTLSKLAGDNAKNYVGPLLNGWGADLNSDLYHTADTHDILGFDIQAKLSAAQISSGDKTYDFKMPATFQYTDPFGLQHTFVAGVDYPSTVKAPTAVGSKDTVGVHTFKTANTLQQSILIFSHPGGFNLPMVPLVMPQASLGLPFGFEAMVRFIPTVKVGDVGKVNFLGFGLRADIGKFIPVPLPIDIAVNFATQKFNFKDSSGSNLLQANAKAYGIQVSKTLAVITFYAGFQLEKSSFTVGPYNAQLNTGNTATTVNVPQFTVDGDNSSSLIVGLRLHLAILNIHAEYDIAKTPVLAAGVGFSIR